LGSFPPTQSDALGADFEVDVDMLRDALLNAGSCNIFYLPPLLANENLRRRLGCDDELHQVSRTRASNSSPESRPPRQATFGVDFEISRGA